MDTFWCPEQGAKKAIFTVCDSGKLRVTFTSPNIISTSPKNVFMSRLISQFFYNLNSSNNFTCPTDKLVTEFTSLIAKSTSPTLSDTTFFARWSRGTKFSNIVNPTLRTLVICTVLSVLLVTTSASCRHSTLFKYRQISVG